MLNGKVVPSIMVVQSAGTKVALLLRLLLPVYFEGLVATSTAMYTAAMVNRTPWLFAGQRTHPAEMWALTYKLLVVLTGRPCQLLSSASIYHDRSHILDLRHLTLAVTAGM